MTILRNILDSYHSTYPDEWKLTANFLPVYRKWGHAACQTLQGKQRVSIDGFYSEFTFIWRGLPQGYSLNPLYPHGPSTNYDY